MENKRLIYLEDALKVMPALEMCWRALRSLPTVDAVEVVHGEWRYGYAIDHTCKVVYHSIDCSVCDGVFKADNFATVEHWKERFEICPFCGAVMDGDNHGQN